MNIKDLRCFQEVYREESIHKAAKKLYITPQGLGKTIQNLEKELNTTLFQRTHHGVKSTESAKLLYGRSDQLIRQFEEMKNEIMQLENQKKVLRIGCACGIFHLLPFRLIYQFIEENDIFSIEWCEYSNQEVKDLLYASQIDYGFIVGDEEEKQLHTRKLIGCGISLLIYKGHPLYEQASVNIEMIEHENLLLMNEHFHMHFDIIEACRGRGFYPNIIAKTADGSSLHKLCMQKMGVAIVPDFMTDDYKMDDLKMIPFEEDLKWEVYSAYKKEHNGYDAISRFDAYLRNNLLVHKKE